MGWTFFKAGKTNGNAMVWTKPFPMEMRRVCKTNQYTKKDKAQVNWIQRITQTPMKLDTQLYSCSGEKRAKVPEIEKGGPFGQACKKAL